MDAHQEHQTEVRSGPNPAERGHARPNGARFDAFLSYCRRDEAVGEELHRALTRFSKPWYRLRALRIFRDRAVLTAGPRLRTSLHDYLRQSRSLIVLASPAAAKSKWVNEEIAFWCQEKPADSVFIVVTDGQIKWDPAAGDFARDRTDCLPPATYGLFAEEPIWSDIRGIGAEQLRSSPRFLQAVVDIAAPLHGRSKDEMFGEDVRQHHRVRQVVTGTLATLTVLTLLAITAAVVAVRQRDLAERRAAIAESRELAVRATDVLSTDPRRAVELGVRAVRRHRTAEAVEALRQGLDLNHVRAILRGGGGAVDDAAVSPDGRQVAIGTENGEVRLWRPGERGQGRRLLLRPAAVFSVGFDPGGQRLAVGYDGGAAVVVDVRTGASVDFRGHGDSPVRIAEFSPDGRHLLTTADDDTSRLWDAGTARQIGSFPDTAQYMDAPHFSGRGGLFATREDGRAVVRDASSGREVSVLPHPAVVSAVTFSPDGRYVVTGGFDKRAMVWEARSGRRVATLTGHSDPVRSVAFSPSGDLVATAAHATRIDTDFTARVWKTRGGEQVSVLRGHTAAVRRVMFLGGEDRVLTASYDGTARVWEARTGEQDQVFAGHAQTIWDASADRAGRLVATASEDGTARVWEADSDQPRLAVSLPGGTTDAGVLSSDRLAVVGPAEARIVQSATGRTITASALYGGVDPLLTVSADRRRVGVDANGSITMFDSTTGRWSSPIAAEPNFYSLNAVNHKVTRAVVLHPNKAPPEIRELPSRRLTAVLQGPSGPWVSAVAFSPDDRYVALGYIDGQTLVFDAASGALYRRLPPSLDRVFAMAFSPDSTVLVTGGGSDLENNSRDTSGRVYDVRSGRLRATLTGHTQAIRAVSFSPDGSIIATASQDDTARLWDARAGHESHLLRGHTGQVWTVKFSGDGAFVVTSSSDRTARVWRVTTGQDIAVLRGHRDEVRSADFNDSGRQIVTTSLDGTARLFTTGLLGDAGDLLTTARQQGVG